MAPERRRVKCYHLMLVNLNRFLGPFLVLSSLAFHVTATSASGDIAGIIGEIADAKTIDERVALARKFTRAAILDRYDVPGLSAAVAVDGEVLWSEGFGLADIEKGSPVTPATKFRIGSVSKVLTAAAVALLIERGKLDLDAPVQRYVPEFPKKGEPITTRQLTGHLAGIRHYEEGEERYREHYDSVISALEVFASDPLVGQPGERWSYSSYGWTLVSAVIERAGKRPFLEFMKAEVFRPLDMNGTAPDDITTKIKSRATGYEGRGTNVKADTQTDLSAIWAAGGFLSTAEDLTRFGSAFLPGSDFLAAGTLKVVFTGQRAADGTATPNGIGWFVDRTTTGEPVYYHGGIVTGGHAILLVRPDDRVVVALLANHASGFDELEANMLASILLGQSEIPVLVGSLERRRSNQASRSALLETLEEWKRSLERADVEAAMSLVSADFAGRTWKDRASLQAAFESLFADAGGIVVEDTEGTHLGIRGAHLGALAHLTGVRVAKLAADSPLRMTFRKEPAGWRLLALQPEPE